jgi:aminoglycoside phosphotransferase (APT) family kinase protein
VLDLSNCTLGDPAAELGRMAAYGTLTRDLLETYADGEPLDDRLIAAYAVDTYALLGLLGRKRSQTKSSSIAACRVWTTACSASG